MRILIISFSLLILFTAGLSPLVGQVIPELPESSLRVESLMIDGNPRWIHGVPHNVSLEVTIRNEGSTASNPYDLFYYYEVRGERTYLNGNQMNSWDRNNEPVEGSGGTHTHTDIPWSLQPEHHGNGRLVVKIEEIKTTVNPNDREVVRVWEQSFPRHVAWHEVALEVEQGDQLIRPFETGFVRASIANHGNTAEVVAISVNTTDLPAGFVPTLEAHGFSVPVGQSRDVAIFVHYDLDASDGSPFNASLLVELETSYGSSFNVSTPHFQNQLGAVPPGAPVWLERADTKGLMVGHGDTLALGFRFGNGGDDRDVYDVNVDTDGDLHVEADLDRAGLFPKEVRTFKVKITPDVHALHGSMSEVRVMVESNRSREPITIMIPVKVMGPEARVAAQVDWSDKAYVGDPVEPRLRLTNHGTEAMPCGHITVAAMGPGLGTDEPVTRSHSVGEISPGRSHLVTVPFDLTYPEGGNVFFHVDWEPEKVICSSLGGEPWVGASEIETTGLQKQVTVHDPMISVNVPAPLKGHPGETVGYRSPPTHAFVVQNEGDTRESVRVQAVPSAGRVVLLLDENPLILGPGESRSIPLDHELPLPSGTLEEATVKVTAFIAERPGLAWNGTAETRIVDVKPPQITIPRDLPRLWAKGAEMDFRVRVTDDSLVNAVNVTHTAPDGTVQTHTLHPSGDGEHWFFPFVSFVEGPHTFIVSATDHWGNQASRTTTLEVATVSPPRITLMGPEDGATVSPAAIFDVLVEDELPIWEVQVVIKDSDSETRSQKNLSLIEGRASFRLQDVLAEPRPEGKLSVTVKAVNVAGAHESVTRMINLSHPEESPHDEPLLEETPGPAWILVLVSILGVFFLRKKKSGRHTPPRKASGKSSDLDAKSSIEEMRMLFREDAP